MKIVLCRTYNVKVKILTECFQIFFFKGFLSCRRRKLKTKGRGERDRDRGSGDDCVQN